MPAPRFWEFAHLSDDFKKMGWVDLVPRAGNLYIGGLHALIQRPDLFKEAKMTHIVSVLDFDIYERGQFEQYKHLMIQVDDEPNEILLKHFEQTNAYINEALDAGGAVFVHCAMGKSRSATVVCAYLMWKYGAEPKDALAQVCEGRAVCSPNPGFMEQLGVYRQMLKADSKEAADSIYGTWEKDRFTGDWWTWGNRGDAAKL